MSATVPYRRKSVSKVSRSVVWGFGSNEGW